MASHENFVQKSQSQINSLTLTEISESGLSPSRICDAQKRKQQFCIFLPVSNDNLLNSELRCRTNHHEVSNTDSFDPDQNNAFACLANILPMSGDIKIEKKFSYTQLGRSRIKNITSTQLEMLSSRKILSIPQTLENFWSNNEKLLLDKNRLNPCVPTLKSG